MRVKNLESAFLGAQSELTTARLQLDSERGATLRRVRELEEELTRKSIEHRDFVDRVVGIRRAVRDVENAIVNAGLG